MNLFVGGEHDGERREVANSAGEIALRDKPSQDITDFRPSDPIVPNRASRTLYRRMWFAGKQRRVSVFAVEGLDADDVLEALVRNYRQRA